MSSFLCISGTTQTPVTTIADCLAIDPNAYIVQAANALASQPTLQDIFSIPLAADLLQMWELGFGLPILCYMTAWAYGTVINFFTDRHS